MNPIESQTQKTDFSPEEAKAALGLSTRLSEQFLVSQAQQMGVDTPVEPQKAQGEEMGMEMGKDAPEMPEMKEKGLEEDHSKKMEEKISKMETDIELIKKAVVKEDNND